MKKALSLLALLFMTAMLPAESPELRFVMPNSWRKITRLPPTEEAAFLRDNGGLLEETQRVSRIFSEHPFNEHGHRLQGETRVYREQAGEDVFYRLIMANSDSPDFSDQWETVFVQTLVYEHRGRMVILGVAPYNGSTVSEDISGRIVKCRSLDIIRSGGRARGVLGTLLEYSAEYLVKGQIQGFINECGYVLLEDTLRVLEGDPGAAVVYSFGGVYRYEGVPGISIRGSPCLVDPAVPLRYGLQNAFDGDPATSYVENTGDDLMEFRMMFSGFPKGILTLKRISFVNGYAQSEQLYNANNRVRNIMLWSNTPLVIQYGALEDKTLTPQIIDIEIPPHDTTYDVRAENFYAGSRYNDTCLAEMDLELLPLGWLFGGIDE